MTAVSQSRHFGRRPTTSGLPLETDVVRAGRHVSKVPHPDSCSAASFGQISRRDQGWRGRAGVAAYGGKRHVGHPGPKPVQAYRVQSW